VVWVSAGLLLVAGTWAWETDRTDLLAAMVVALVGFCVWALWWGSQRLRS
jgi:hypothetical protein